MKGIGSILVIDDSEDDQRLCRRVLQKVFNGELEILSESSGEDGIETIKRRGSDCVLLDYSLPGRNGLEVLKRIRAKYPNLPVVMLTGQGNEVVAVEVMKAGAQDYIVKSDITEDSLYRVVKMAVERCQMQRQIDEQQRALELFTRALAHDLKEPVRTILSFLSLLERDDNRITEKSRQHLKHIGTSADRMYQLVESVFAYTRLSHVASLERTECATEEVIADVKLLLSRQIEEKQAVVTHDPLPQVLAHRTHLTQVFQNLISNAVRFSEVRSEVHIGAERRGDEIEFYVRDNGPGIAPEHLQRIFEPFKRFSQEDGAGLGLATCVKIVEYHGGRIWCESAAGEGAVFRFTLPNGRERDEARSDTATGQAAAQVPTPVLANVLLVEDHLADVELARIMLMEQDNLQFNLYSARDGKAAVQFLEDESKPAISLVLLDINMPEMDGFEFLKYCRENEPLQHIPVIMCSTSNFDEDVEKAKSYGAIGYILKPPQFEKMHAILNQVRSLHLEPTADGYRLVRAA